MPIQPEAHHEQGERSAPGRWSSQAECASWGEGSSPADWSAQERIEDLGGLVGEGLAGIVGVAADAHRAIGAVVEAALPEPARPVAAASTALTGGVYTIVGAAHRWIPPGAAALFARAHRDPPRVEESTVGRALLPVVNGFWGDRIARDRPSLAIAMSVRVGGVDLALTPAAVAAAFPDAQPHLVAFVHGLVETEQAWWPGAAAGETPHSFGDRLGEDLPATSVYLRYNTGAHVSDNGAALAELLDALVALWPVPVTRISLVGHSMGGLVARSAAEAATREGRTWVSTLATVVTLGTPHLGAPLEKGVHALVWSLRRTSLSAPYARPLGARSAGIKDLRHGAVVETDWPDDDVLVAFDLPEARLLPHVRYGVLAGTITTDPDHPAGRLVGDGMVRIGSATGRGRVRRYHFGPPDPPLDTPPETAPPETPSEPRSEPRSDTPPETAPPDTLPQTPPDTRSDTLPQTPTDAPPGTRSDTRSDTPPEIRPQIAALGGLHHLALLHHPDVYPHVRDWLDHPSQHP